MDAGSRPITIATAAALVLGYLLNLIPWFRSTNLLTLVVANTFMGYFFIWTVLTSSFVEENWLKLLIDLGLLAAISSHLEEMTDYLRVLVYLVVVAVGSSLATSISIFVGFVITRMEGLLFSATLGFNGLFMAYLMLLKQKMPSEVVFNPLPSLRMQHLPFAWLSVCVLARAVGLSWLTADLPLAIWSFWVSWVYLRFVQHNADGTVGDMSEDFAMVNLFPRALRAYLGPIFQFTYGVAVLCGMCKDRELAMAATMSEEAATPELPTVLITKTKVDPIAERRKAKAMKVLDAKLAAMAKETMTSSENRNDGLGPSQGSHRVPREETRYLAASNVDIDVSMA